MIKGRQIPFIRPVPDYGHKMTIGEWLECVENGGFIDYDGHGYTSDGIMMSDKCIVPSDVSDEKGKQKAIPEGTTHIIWMNK